MIMEGKDTYVRREMLHNHACGSKSGCCLPFVIDHFNSTMAFTFRNYGRAINNAGEQIGAKNLK